MILPENWPGPENKLAREDEVIRTVHYMNDKMLAEPAFWTAPDGQRETIAEATLQVPADHLAKSWFFASWQQAQYHWRRSRYNNVEYVEVDLDLGVTQSGEPGQPPDIIRTIHLDSLGTVHDATRFATMTGNTESDTLLPSRKVIQLLVASDQMESELLKDELQAFIAMFTWTLNRLKKSQ